MLPGLLKEGVKKWRLPRSGIVWPYRKSLTGEASHESGKTVEGERACGKTYRVG